MYFRLMKLQSKVKELSREVRNKEEEIEDQRRMIDNLKQEKRKGEKAVNEVFRKYYLFKYPLKKNPEQQILGVS